MKRQMIILTLTIVISLSTVLALIYVTNKNNFVYVNNDNEVSFSANLFKESSIVVQPISSKEFIKKILRGKKLTEEYVKERHGLEIPPPSKEEFLKMLKRLMANPKFKADPCPFIGYGWVYFIDSNTGKIVDRKTHEEIQVGDRLLSIYHVFTINGEYVGTVIEELIFEKKEIFAWQIVRGQKKPVYKFSGSTTFCGWLKMKVKP